jgi:outer membrane protein assembly factor BamB
MRVFRILILSVVGSFSLLAQNAIQHRFVATDESGHQILLVDEANPAKGWVVKQHARDLQLVGDNRVMVSVNGKGGTAKNGFLELDLDTGKIVRRVEVPGFKRVMTARRAADGTTYLGGYGPKGICIVQVGKDGKTLKTIDCAADIKNIRLMRRTATGTFLIGSGPEIFEVDTAGKIVWRQKIAGGNHIYKAVRLPNGNTFLASGYGAFLAEFSPEGKAVRTFGRTDGQKVAHPKFFADFQLLPNGHVVVANWMGHKREDSQKGQQLAEYDADGKLVWTWHDAKLAGCIHGVIVLDGLDTTKLHTELTGTLAPAK